MRYTLQSDSLLLRSGVMRKRIPFADIRSVEYSGDPTASWAWSLQRVAIHTRDGGTTLISPIRRDEFVSELMKRV